MQTFFMSLLCFVHIDGRFLHVSRRPKQLKPNKNLQVIHPTDPTPIFMSFDLEFSDASFGA